MVTVLRLRIGVLLLSFAIVVYVSLGAFQTDVTHGIHDAFIRNHSQFYVQPLNTYVNSTNIIRSVQNEQMWLSDQNFTVIQREFYLYLASRLRDTPYPGVENFTRYVIAQSGLKPLTGVKKLRPDFGPVLNDVTFYRYPIAIQSCQSRIFSNNATTLFVAIISAPSYFHKRKIIRQTWLRDLKMRSDLGSVNLVGYAFVVGLPENEEIQKQIEEENETYRDILQIEMIDHYYNLTVKVVGLLNWMNDYCSQVDFVLKIDDDVYVNTKNFLTVIRSLNASEQSNYGSIVDSPPLREGKWYISWDDWPWSNYPMYFSGAAVILPGCTIAPLLAAAQTIPYLPFDDTFLTGLCTSKAGIKVRDSYWLFVAWVEDVPNPCDVYTTVTWLTVSVEHLNRSHWATKDFYENLTQCILEESDGTNRTADPMEDLVFSFSV
ncbi:lactosylceramide 1,3-N-acetyl-beta-D-glucosaminyltransferase isoform X2 [Daphnia magna]|uniref:lactosylceramide 1,3-N-acetyl-beta-D-glucosaminyltransferase isoform X2 n=1 Tax=Daphnia magna TaxID=35525 RepID=UPI001E1BBDFA|nr:lactosylceramide 1,3-N-acetyl-beta-D-glucosaminyltransferase isoform X2 [Daphnia magna]